MVPLLSKRAPSVRNFQDLAPVLLGWRRPCQLDAFISPRNVLRSLIHLLERASVLVFGELLHFLLCQRDLGLQIAFDIVLERDLAGLDRVIFFANTRDTTSH